MKRTVPIATILLAFGMAAQGQDVDQAKKALDLIAEFSSSICGTPPLEGTSTDAALSATGRVALSSLLRKLAQLRIDGVAKYQSSDYEGLLQKDLVTSFKDARACRMTVFADLSDRLFPKSK